MTMYDYQPSSTTTPQQVDMMTTEKPLLDSILDFFLRREPDESDINAIMKELNLERKRGPPDRSVRNSKEAKTSEAGYGSKTSRLTPLPRKPLRLSPTIQRLKANAMTYSSTNPQPPRPSCTQQPRSQQKLVKTQYVDLHSPDQDWGCNPMSRPTNPILGILREDTENTANLQFSGNLTRSQPINIPGQAAERRRIEELREFEPTTWHQSMDSTCMGTANDLPSTWLR